MYRGRAAATRRAAVVSGPVTSGGTGTGLVDGRLPIDLYDPRTYTSGVPHEAFAVLRRECPVYRQEERAILGWPAGPGYWTVTRYHDVVFVNRNPALFSSHQGATQIRDPKPEDL